MKTLPNIIPALFLSITTASMAAVPALSRKEIMDYARTAAGSRYIFGGSKWDPQDRKFGGPDCAGLVLKAWRWPLEIGYRDVLKPEYKIDGRNTLGKLYTGTMLENTSRGLPWSKSRDYSAMQVADAFTYNNGKRGHTFLVAGENNGMVQSVEARSAKLGVGHFERSESYIRNAGYYLMKRENVKGTLKTSTPVVAAKPKSTFHKISTGETLSEIAKKYKVPASHIAKLNPSKIKNGQIRVGDQIQVL